MDNIAVVGAGGGLGKYLAHRFAAVSFCRGDDLSKLAGVDIIIYCAAKAHFETPLKDLYAAVDDNFLLLDRISKAPHSRFIYISTVDVYPQGGIGHEEDEILTIENISGGYPSFKLMGEALVHQRCNHPLILRPTSLFGDGMRPNNIMRMLTGLAGDLTLKADASFNCITYDMVAQLIEAAVGRDISGTFNCAASDTVTLEQVASLCGYIGKYGMHAYQAPDVSNVKAAALVEDFSRSSFDVISSIFAGLRMQTLRLT